MMSVPASCLAMLALVLPVLTAVATAAPTAQGGADDPRQVLARAMELHQAGDIEGAIRQYRAFLERHPDAADVRSNLGAAYVRLGHLQKGISEYERAIALGNATDPTAVRFNLALAYYKAVQLSQAVEALSQVLAEQPGHKNAALLLANCHLSAGENQKVIDLLSPLEAAHGDDRARAYLLGTALIREGALERGQKLIDVILREGDSAEARFMMGTAHLEKGDPPAAAAEFRRAVELNPRLPSLNAFLGKTLSEMSLVDEAAECFRRELEVNPNDFDSNLYLGMHLRKAEQDYGQALAHLQRALQARPGSPDARYQIGLVYILVDRIDEALEMIEGVVEEVPEFLEGHATLTRLYYRLGRREDAGRHRAIVDELRAKREAEALVAARPPSP
jgi:tetratricopeptide (TPR) repeat protein